MEKLIFDSHAHYYDEAFDSDRDELLKSLPDEGVYKVINSGSDIITSKKCIEISKKYPYCLATVGIHPENANNVNCGFTEELESLLINNNVAGIGEIGLDYYYSSENRNLQKDIFIKQVKLSKKYNLPIIVHDREAHDDTLEIIKNYNPKGVIHCFSGNLDMANKVTELGVFIGIGGIITFKNAKKLAYVVKNISLEYILLETDAPYLSPVPHRGKRCKSSYIKYVAKKIADIKNVSAQEVLSITRKNSLLLFGAEGNL
jgi:TatD DNase family protein